MAIDWQSRRDGFDHRKYKPTDAPINWKYWGSLQDIKQWDACALSLNINPDCLKAKKMAMPGKPEFLDASFPSEAALLEFYKRLTMLNRETQERYLEPVNPAWFAAWCVRIELADLPPELVAMALQPAPVAPTAPATDAATPAPVAIVSDGPTPLTTGDIAYCFAGLRWDESAWKKPLGDKPKWLLRCVAIPGQQGVSETRWNPVLIGAELVQQGHVKARSVRAKFQTVDLLSPWLDDWKTYEADNLDNE